MDPIIQQLYGPELDEACNTMHQTLDAFKEEHWINLIKFLVQMEMMAMTTKEKRLSHIKLMALAYAIPIVRAKFNKDYPMPEPPETPRYGTIKPHWVALENALQEGGERPNPKMRAAFYGGVSKGLSLALDFMDYKEGGREHMQKLVSELLEFAEKKLVKNFAKFS